MAMELLSFHNQLIAYLSANEKHDNFAFINILQNTKVSHSQFVFGEQIGAQFLDCFRWGRRLVFQSGENRGFQYALVVDRQRSQLPFGILGNRNLERHGCPLLGGQW
jgi:hypothetical protein